MTDDQHATTAAAGGPVVQGKSTGTAVGQAYGSDARLINSPADVQEFYPPGTAPL
ncbi:MAG TPA: hypothetical protein VFW50_27545 [Streptosporangiaceae bacterium]|nr:hypothetical protein [Streptosporangiaceae bacterium]